jgi:phage shock protein A
MEAITRIENLITEMPDKKPSVPEDTLTSLEHFIDRMVTAENKIAKAAAQAAIRQRQIREEFERRVAFLSSRLHQAETALAALEESLSRVEKSPGDIELLNTKRSEVVFWRSQLHQVCPPSTANLLI